MFTSSSVHWRPYFPGTTSQEFSIPKKKYIKPHLGLENTVLKSLAPIICFKRINSQQRIIL